MPDASRLAFVLPQKFGDATDETTLREYAGQLADFISSRGASSILLAHPNEIATDGPKESWLEWWNQVGKIPTTERESFVKGLFNDYNPTLPPQLQSLLSTAKVLQLPRTQSPDLPSFSNTSHTHTKGMSSKKLHEVSCLSALISSSHSNGNISHIVDVGSGQGYLSRALSSPPHSFHILALDSDSTQTHGAQRRDEDERKRVRKYKSISPERVLSNSGSVRHKTIRISAETLPKAIDDGFTWPEDAKLSVPVMLVGLHTCGSLTPSVLRTFVSLTRMQSVLSRRWKPSGLAIVGCCYNLMNPEDFPMSSYLTSHPSLPTLTPHHLQQAAQTPSIWTQSPSSWNLSKLSRKKVIYRALLGKLLGSSGRLEGCAKIGRLNDKVFESWDTYLCAAFSKINMSPLPPSESSFHDTLSFQLEVLYILRSMLGPVVESLILMDRYLYLKEELGEGRMVNVFDQASGSARNVCLVVEGF